MWLDAACSATIDAARWRKRRRESSASLFILVQIQAGPLMAFNVRCSVTSSDRIIPRWRALTSNILIDTTQVATDTIDYVATDTWGNTSTSTRTIIIDDAASSSPSI
jgi:hypothetical protein